MTPEILSTLLQASGAAGISIAAFYYFNIISKRHSDSLTTIVDKNTEVLIDVTRNYNRVTQLIAVKLEKITKSNKDLIDSNKELQSSNLEFKEALQKVYIHNLKEHKKEEATYA